MKIFRWRICEQHNEWRGEKVHKLCSEKRCFKTKVNQKESWIQIFGRKLIGTSGETEEVVIVVFWPFHWYSWIQIFERKLIGTSGETEELVIVVFWPFHWYSWIQIFGRKLIGTSGETEEVVIVVFWPFHWYTFFL